MAADAAGQPGHGDLRDADSGISEVEAADAEGAEEQL
jgi:hypothetical protein